MKRILLVLVALSALMVPIIAQTTIPFTLIVDSAHIPLDTTVTRSFCNSFTGVTQGGTLAVAPEFYWFFRTGSPYFTDVSFSNFRIYNPKDALRSSPTLIQITDLTVVQVPSIGKISFEYDPEVPPLPANYLKFKYLDQICYDMTFHTPAVKPDGIPVIEMSATLSDPNHPTVDTKPLFLGD